MADLGRERFEPRFAVASTAAVPALCVCLSVWAGGVRADTTGTAADQPAADLTELSLEQLFNVKVISVEKRPEALRDTPAAVSVITSEEIESSGATTLPSLLRRVPGVHVARLDASQWAIGIRGFTNSVARSQLALMDGRSLYTPLFAGTYWDVQNTVLEDVDRIEVVRGPGGTLWGANAVNGIVNVITKSASDTKGGLVSIGGGNQERAFGRLRLGRPWGERAAYRVYASYFDREPEAHRDGHDYDGWHMAEGGFRTDWAPTSSQTLTVQGDAYSGRAGRRTTFATFVPPYLETREQEARLSGGNLRTRWSRAFSNGREVAVQAYYDRTNRHEPNFSEVRDTFDVDAQYRLPLGGRQELTAGLGYRVSNGRSASVPTLGFVPPDKTDALFNAFLLDTLQLVPGRLSLALGTKMERNGYSGFELQPSGRLSFAAGARHSVWLAATRAVRTPTRFDRDLVLNLAVAPGRPVFVRLLGDPGFETERSRVYEAGYRARLSQRIGAEVDVFYNRYPNLVSYEAGAPFLEDGRFVLPLRTANGTVGEVEGVELSSDMRPGAHWLIRASYSYLNMKLAPRLSSGDTGSSSTEDASPRHQVFVSSSARLFGRLSSELAYRWIARLPSQGVKAYAELDARLAWRTGGHLDLSLVGRDLLHARHVEFGSGAIGASDAGAVQIRRSVFGEATLRW